METGLPAEKLALEVNERSRWTCDPEIMSSAEGGLCPIQGGTSEESEKSRNKLRQTLCRECEDPEQVLHAWRRCAIDLSQTFVYF